MLVKQVCCFQTAALQVFLAELAEFLVTLNDQVAQLCKNILTVSSSSEVLLVHISLLLFSLCLGL